MRIPQAFDAELRAYDIVSEFKSPPIGVDYERLRELALGGVPIAESLVDDPSEAVRTLSWDLSMRVALHNGLDNSRNSITRDWNVSPGAELSDPSEIPQVAQELTDIPGKKIALVGLHLGRLGMARHSYTQLASRFGWSSKTMKDRADEARQSIVMENWVGAQLLGVVDEALSQGASHVHLEGARNLNMRALSQQEKLSPPVLNDYELLRQRALQFVSPEQRTFIHIYDKLGRSMPYEKFGKVGGSIWGVRPVRAADALRTGMRALEDIMIRMDRGTFVEPKKEEPVQEKPALSAAQSPHKSGRKPATKKATAPAKIVIPIVASVPEVDDDRRWLGKIVDEEPKLERVWALQAQLFGHRRRSPGSERAVDSTLVSAMRTAIEGARALDGDAYKTEAFKNTLGYAGNDKNIAETELLNSLLGNPEDGIAPQDFDVVLADMQQTNPELTADRLRARVSMAVRRLGIVAGHSIVVERPFRPDVNRLSQRSVKGR